MDIADMKKVREAKGMTQKCLADKLHCTRKTIYRYENGLVKRKDYDFVLKMTEVLEMEKQRGDTDVKTKQTKRININCVG